MTDLKESDVEQAQLELQLKVWKELAISKQVLMRSATDALKLDPNCSQDELKTALEAVIEKIAESDTAVGKAQREARIAIAEMEKKLNDAQRAQARAEAASEESRQAQENAIREIAAERAHFLKETQALKDRVADREKAMKAIHTALADTPENVVKKLRALRKEKQDAVDERKLVEANLVTVRKEKREQEQKLTELQERNGKLVTAHRALHETATKLHEQLKPLLSEGQELPAVPELDETLLGEGDEKDKKGRK